MNRYTDTGTTSAEEILETQKTSQSPQRHLSATQLSAAMSQIALNRLNSERANWRKDHPGKNYVF